MTLVHRLALTLTLAVAVTHAASPARGQDGFDEEPARPEVQAENNFAFDDSNFEQWVFNGRTTGDGRGWFAVQLALRLDELEQVCGLLPLQRAKLELAGAGDVKRFYDKYDVSFRRFQAVKHDQNKVNQIWGEIQPLQEAVNDSFGTRSLFGRTIPRTLSADQWRRYHDATERRRASRHRARVSLVVALLDASIGMSADQRRAFTDLVPAEPKLPARSGQFDYYFVLYQVATVPEAKVKAVFDETQWRALSPLLTQARGYEGMLRAQKYLEPAGGSPPAEEPDTDTSKEQPDVFLPGAVPVPPQP